MIGPTQDRTAAAAAAHMDFSHRVFVQGHGSLEPSNGVTLDVRPDN